MPPRPSSSSNTKRSFTTQPGPNRAPSATDRPKSVQLEPVGRDPVGPPVPVGYVPPPVPVGAPQGGPPALPTVPGAVLAEPPARGGRNCVFSASADDDEAAAVDTCRGAR